MFERHGELEKFYEIVERFRQKGAVSPDKAMTVEELGLPPRFETAMKGRLGRSGIFVEVNGRYYLSEERLKQTEELRSSRGPAWALRKRIMTLRIVQIITAFLFLALFLVSFFIRSWELRVLSILFLVVWLVISAIQLYYLSRVRKMMYSRTPQATAVFTRTPC
jgi:hypothetical protein